MTTFCVISEKRLRIVLALVSFGAVFLYAAFGSYSQSADDGVEVVDSGGWRETMASVRPRQRLLAGPSRRSYGGDEEGFTPDTIFVSSRMQNHACTSPVNLHVTEVF